MEYALITLHRSVASAQPFIGWLPRLFHRFFLQLVPPRDVGIPGGLVFRAGRGHIIMAPVTRDIADSHPGQAMTALQKAHALASQVGADVVAAPPDVARLLGAGVLHGVTTSMAGTLMAMKRWLSGSDERGAKHHARFEVAITGTSFREVMALFLCLSEFSDGVHMVHDDVHRAERLAQELWRETGIAARMHRSLESAMSRADVVLIGASPAQPVNPVRPHQLIVDVRGVSHTTAALNSTVVRAPVFDLLERLPEGIELEPPALAPLIEAALATAEAATGFTTHSPQPKDVRKVERLLVKASIGVSAVWDGKNTVLVDALTPISA